MNEKLLEVQGLEVDFHLEEGVLGAVRGIDLEVERGDVLGIVGESGCGKSVTARAILRLITPPGRIRGREDPLRREGSSRPEFTQR